MGNTSDSTPSSLLVQTSQVAGLLRPELNDQKDSERSRATDTERRLSYLENRKLVCEPKFKMLPQPINNHGNDRNEAKKPQKSSYFSMGKLQVKAEKNQPKQKIKLVRQKTQSVGRDQGSKILSPRHNQKNEYKLKSSVGKDTKSFDKLKRPFFLSPGGSASKRKLSSIKQSSLNKQNWNSEGQKKSAKQLPFNPYLENRSETETKKNSKLKINSGSQPVKNLETRKSKDKVSSVHQFYFSRNEKQKIYIPLESHRNPLGRSKRPLDENKVKELKIKPCHSSLVSSIPEVSQGREKLKQSILILRQKQYSICEDDHNFSRMMIQEVESQIKLECEEVRTPTKYVLDQSIIVRGLEGPY